MRYRLEAPIDNPMSQLAQLLQLLHDAPGSLDSLRAEYRDWFRPRATEELIVHRHAPEDGHPRVHWRGPGPFPPEIVSVTRISCRRPDLLRVEVFRGDRLIRFGVLNGGRWWRWDEGLGAEASRAPASGVTGWWVPPLLAPPLLEPVMLLASLRVVPAGSGMRVGRRVLRARATPRGPAPFNRRLAYELEFDAEHGTVLRYAAFEDDELVRLTEAREIGYHVEIDPDWFMFASPDGRSVQRLEPHSTRRAERAHDFATDVPDA
jgi:hypothetical protein